MTKAINYLLAVLAGGLFSLSASAVTADETPEEPLKEQVLTTDMVAERVSEALQINGAGDKIEAEFMGRHLTIMHRSDKPITFELSNLDYNEQSLRWQGDLRIFEQGKLAEVTSLRGRYASLVELPVLRQRLYDGEIIEEDDIEWQFFPEHRIRKETIYKMGDLLGRSPKRVISKSRPIRAYEVEAPVIVERGDMVQVSFNTPYMQIRTLGEAMEDGAVDDMINIRNSNSGITIRARLIAPGQAQVVQLMQVSQAVR